MAPANCYGEHDPVALDEQVVCAACGAEAETANPEDWPDADEELRLLLADDSLRADGGYETVTVTDDFVRANVAPAQEARSWCLVQTDEGDDYWVPTRLDPDDVDGRDAVPDPDVLPGDAVLQFPLESREPELAAGAMPAENVRNRVVE